MYLATLRPRPYNAITLSIYHLEDCERQKDNRGDSYHLSSRRTWYSTSFQLKPSIVVSSVLRDANSHAINKYVFVSVVIE